MLRWLLICVAVGLGFVILGSLAITAAYWLIAAAFPISVLLIFCGILGYGLIFPDRKRGTQMMVVTLRTGDEKED